MHKINGAVKAWNFKRTSPNMFNEQIVLFISPSIIWAESHDKVTWCNAKKDTWMWRTCIRSDGGGHCSKMGR